MKILDSFRLYGKVICITGASGQIGKALVKAYQEAGADVVPTDLDTEIPLDVTDKKSVEKARDAIVAKYGKIDILVNNAGIAVFIPFEERTVEEFDKVMNVNVRGTFLCSQVFAEELKKTYGCIINVGSIYGMVSADKRIYGNSGRNSSEVYAASKAGIIHMTRYLATYLAPNIRVNCVSPGGVFNNQDEHFIRSYEFKTPLGRMATADDLVGAFIFLASDSARYITGQNIAVDGGFTLW
jgi:NAD(P)-dependent dehydrogenase (short-subunit alcohol dehydrogenase family)